MGRVIIVLIFVGGIFLYINWQYHNVVREVTNPNSAAHRPMARGWPREPQESRRKCLICGGTGRTSLYGLSISSPGKGQVCPTCKGTGWVDNPMFDR